MIERKQVIKQCKRITAQNSINLSIDKSGLIAGLQNRYGYNKISQSIVGDLNIANGILEIDNKIINNPVLYICICQFLRPARSLTGLVVIKRTGAAVILYV